MREYTYFCFSSQSTGIKLFFFSFFLFNLVYEEITKFCMSVVPTVGSVPLPLSLCRHIR